MWILFFLSMKMLLTWIAEMLGTFIMTKLMLLFCSLKPFKILDLTFLTNESHKRYFT